MLVAVPPFEWEGDILNENARTINNRTYDSKLYTNFQKDFPFRFALVKCGGHGVEPHGYEVCKDETGDPDPRNTQRLDELLIHYFLSREKLRSRSKVGYCVGLMYQRSWVQAPARAN